jgi:hypothetical protein
VPLHENLDCAGVSLCFRAQAQACCLTGRSSGPPPAWPAMQLRLSFRIAGQAGSGPSANTLGVMNKIAGDYIAGWNTPDTWYAARDKLVVGSPNGWQKALSDFYLQRLSLRYLDPIKVLQESGESRGEGFSIMAIQCSLIEFLESTVEGLTYRWLPRGQVPGPFEYSSSRDVFVAFLRNRAPFSATFDEASSQDFYESVRCGLLHEARTKRGWRIWAAGPVGMVADTKERIAYRNNFQAAILEFLNAYEELLPNSSQLQAAFVRKLDSLCT